MRAGVRVGYGGFEDVDVEDFELRLQVVATDENDDDVDVDVEIRPRGENAACTCLRLKTEECASPWICRSGFCFLLPQVGLFEYTDQQ